MTAAEIAKSFGIRVYTIGAVSYTHLEKKETLDKGLSKTKESVFSKIARAVAGKSKVDDEVLDNLEEMCIRDSSYSSQAYYLPVSQNDSLSS